MKQIRIKACGHLFVEADGFACSCVYSIGDLKRSRTWAMPENMLAVQWVKEADDETRD